jgi:hypothetical protein
MPPIHAWAMLAVAAAWTAAGLESIEFAGTLLPYLGNSCADLIALSVNAFFLRWPLPSLTRRLRYWLFSAFGVLVAIGVLDTYTFPAWRSRYDPWDFRFLQLTVPLEFHGHVVVPLHTGWLIAIETVTLVIIWRRMRRFTGPARTGQAAVVAAFGANYLLDVVVNGTRIPTLWDGPWAPEWPSWFPFLGALDNLVTFVLVVSPLVDLLLRRTAAAVVVDEVVPREDRPADDPLLDVRVLLYVERESQKGIVIGKGGSRLREVGTRARREIQALLGQRVHLDLRVKVAKDWQRDPKQLQRLGF